MFVQATNSLAVESGLLDLELGSIEQLLRQIFDCKSNRLCGACEAPVTYRPVALAAARGEQLGRGVIVKGRDLLSICHARSDLAGVQPRYELELAPLGLRDMPLVTCRSTECPLSD